MFWKICARPKRRWLIRAVTVLLGFLMAAALSNHGSARAKQSFAAAYAPFVAVLQATRPGTICEAAPEAFATVSAYNEATRDTRRIVAVATLNHDASHFILAFQGRSIDIDGSTIYLDSSNGTWILFHNDNAAAAEKYRALTAGLAECQLRAAAES